MATGVFLDSNGPPARADVVAALGDRLALWDRLTASMEAMYGLEGEPLFGGRDDGWVVRYRRSGRTLLVLMPKAGGFVAHVVIGPKVADGVAALSLEPATRATFDRAKAYPDGRWLWLDVTTEAEARDVERLMMLKSPPPRRPRRVSAGGSPC